MEPFMVILKYDLHGSSEGLIPGSMPAAGH